MSRKLFEWEIEPDWLNRQLAQFSKERAEELEFCIENGEWKGYLSLEKNNVSYVASFEILELDLEGDLNQEWLVVLMDQVPKVEAQGNLLHSIGTGIANYFSQFMTLESVHGFLEDRVSGLHMRENDMMFDLRLRFHPKWTHRLLSFLFRNGLQIRFFPKGDKLCMQLCWRRKEMPKNYLS